MNIVLSGRNQTNLDLMVRYAQYHLEPWGWNVESTTEYSEALCGANIVVNQIRYGGLELREASETFCNHFYLAADETLGCGALYTALRLAAYLQETVSLLIQFCPDAMILNLTNPLSSVTAFIADRLPNCLGLCELPVYTSNEVARILNLPASEIQWSYCGLNHRGFIYDIRIHNRELLNELLRGLGSRKIGGLSAHHIRELQAIPLKYFRLVTENQTPPSTRARFLSRLRNTIIQELRSEFPNSPPSLKQRYMEWYPLAVVPVIAALQNREPSEQLVNVLAKDGIVEELKAKVSAEGISYTPPQRKPSEKVTLWLEKYRRHERAFVTAMKEPSHEAVLNALSLDPTIPQSRVKEISATLWHGFDVEQHSKSSQVYY